MTTVIKKQAAIMPAINCRYQPLTALIISGVMVRLYLPISISIRPVKWRAKPVAIKQVRIIKTRMPTLRLFLNKCCTLKKA